MSQTHHQERTSIPETTQDVASITSTITAEHAVAHQDTNQSKTTITRSLACLYRIDSTAVALNQVGSWEFYRIKNSLEQICCLHDIAASVLGRM